MKALTLWQPWASAMAEGVKWIETRSWRTHYRGELAIHSAKRKVLERIIPPQLKTWRGVGVLPLGEVLGVVRVVNCIPTEEARVRFPSQVPFGDFAPGRWAWITESPRKLAGGVEFTGSQGLWDLPDDLELQLEDLEA